MTPESVQGLMDAGFSIRKIARMYKVHHTKITRYILKHNLEWYVAFDEDTLESKMLWNYDENYRIIKCKYGYESKEECMRDVVSQFVQDFDPNEITSKLLKEYRCVESYIYTLHTNLQSFYDYYGLDGDFISYSRESKLGMYTRLGHEFERLVERVLTEKGENFIKQKTVKNCRPDFVVENHWYDAKLSRSTSFNKGCETLKKYRKHANYLTIIYGLHDTSLEDDWAEFVHISEYLPFLSTKLQRDINAFLNKVSSLRFGEVSR